MTINELQIFRFFLLPLRNCPINVKDNVIFIHDPVHFHPAKLGLHYHKPMFLQIAPYFWLSSVGFALNRTGFTKKALALILCHGKFHSEPCALSDLAFNSYFAI